jgi:hypothetical protein
MVGAETTMDSAYDCREVVELEREPRHHLILANEFMRAFAVDIPPHDRTLCHRHSYHYLVYVASCAAEIISAPRDGESKATSYSDGQCELSEAGLVHVVENLRDTPFRNIVIELLPRVEELRRGRVPQRRLSAEEPGETVASPGPGSRPVPAAVPPHFESERVAVYRLDTDAGGEIELTGPAVVASPYDHKLELELPSEGKKRLTGFHDLIWLGPMQKGTLRGIGRAVVFYLGRREELRSSVLAETAETNLSKELATASSTVTNHRK